MRIYEIESILDSLGNEQREILLNELTPLLSKLSRRMMDVAQLEWDGTKPPREYFKYQNAILKKIIDFEVGELGDLARKLEGLSHLSAGQQILV